MYTRHVEDPDLVGGVKLSACALLIRGVVSKTLLSINNIILALLLFYNVVREAIK
jgi:hypothetical protein